MNKTIRNGLLALAIFGAGLVAGHYLLQPGSREAPDVAERKPLYWVAPMDASYRRDGPGKSPMDMDLLPVYEEDIDGADEGTVTISPGIQSNLGVRTAKVVSGPMAERIDSVGYTEFDEDRLHHFHSRVDGWIGELRVTSTGDKVTAGQKLFDLYSPALVSSQEEFLAARRSGNERLIQAARDKLNSLGVGETQIQRLEESNHAEQYLSFFAARSGYVSQLNARHGMYVTPAMQIMSVGELASIWVIAEVFERQANWVKPNQRVEITSESYPGRTWNAEVDYIYPILDEATRTLRVRVRINNEDEALRPNMLVNISFFGSQPEDVITVPSEAVIQTGHVTRVVKVVGDGQFKSVIVTPGRASRGQTEILAGLTAGDEVVVSGQFLIDSESNIAAELGRIEGGRAAGMELDMDSDTDQKKNDPGGGNP
jgi:Cu(I)/Ag(I) efflux system membrane fusion protein